MARVRTRSPGANRSVLMGQLQLLGRRHALLLQQRGDGGEPALVVGGTEVALVRQPFVRVAELVEVVVAPLDQRTVEREVVRLPVGVEARLVGLLDDRREPGHPAHVVDPAHGQGQIEATMIAETASVAAAVTRLAGWKGTCISMAPSLPGVSRSRTTKAITCSAIPTSPNTTVQASAVPKPLVALVQMVVKAIAPWPRNPAARAMAALTERSS